MQSSRDLHSSAILQFEHAVRRVPDQGRRAASVSAFPRRVHGRAARARVEEPRPERHPDLRFDDAKRDSVAYALEVLRRWLVVVAAVAICLAAGVVIAGVNSEKRYESSTRVLFGTSSLSNAVLQVNGSSDDPEREAATNVLLAGSRRSRAACGGDLGLSTSVSDLLDKVQVEAEQNANVLGITATDSDPRPGRRDGKNAFGREFIAFRTRGDQESIDAAGTRPPVADGRAAGRRSSAPTCATRSTGSTRCRP